MARVPDPDALYSLSCIAGPLTIAVGAVLNPITIPTVKAKVCACEFFLDCDVDAVAQ